jgi:hypothetical protein
MMRGYLDAAGTGQEGVVTITGLTGYFKSYQVAIYFDGDNGAAWRVAQYTITNTATSEQLFQGSGEDSEGVLISRSGHDRRQQEREPQRPLSGSGVRRRRQPDVAGHAGTMARVTSCSPGADR